MRENEAQLIAGGIIVLFVVGILQWIIRGFARLLSSAPIVDDEGQRWDQVKQTLRQPKQMPDGRWMQAQLSWKECDAPMAPNDLSVHDTTSPNHDPKTCKHCKPLKGYSGVSFRSPN